MTDDPELARVTELLAAERTGTIDDAGREELALYGDQPELLAHARARVPALVAPASATGPAGHQDQAWLARVREDEAIVQANQARRTKIERGLGAGMIVGGWTLTMFGSALGVVMGGVGVLLVLASFVRVRIQQRDPYDEIKR